MAFWLYTATIAVISHVASWLVPDIPKQDGGGASITKPDTDTMEAVIYGEMGRVAGTTQHLATNDADNDDVENDLLHMIITWGESVSEIIDVYVDDITATSTAWNDSKNSANKWLWCYNYVNGLRISSSPLLEKTGFNITRHKFTEKAVTYIRAEWDNGKLFNGKPNCLAHVKGRAVWDPRTDEWGWSDNPVLCLLDYLTNIRYGKGMLLDDIDINSFKIAADICETQVETEIGSGEYQNLFTCNIRIDTTNTVKDNVDILLKGCRGLLPEINGITTLIIEQDDAVTSEKITEDLITGNIKIKESGANERYNRVIVSFIDKEQNWKSQEAIWPATAQHNLFKAEDNGKLLEKKITLETATNYNEALQMARILCLLSREALSGTIECAPECIQFTVGDIVPISHSSPMWVDKPFRITNVDYHKEGTVTLHVREHQPYIYNWDGVIRSIPDVTYHDPRNVQSPTSLALLPLADSKLELTWESSRTTFIVHVYNNDDVIVFKGEPNEKKFIIEKLAQGSYSAEVAAVSGVGYLSDWSVIQFNILLPTVPSITIDSISDDSVSLSATVGGLPSLETTFLWQFLGTTSSPVTAKVVKGDIFTYTGLLPETTYKFKCRTVNIAGESDWVEISATTLESNALVSNISIEQLDENLASIIGETNRDFAQLSDRVTEEEIRTIENLGSDIEAEIQLQTNTVKLDGAESNISTLNIQSAGYTSVLNQITHSQTGILAQANDYTYNGVGRWVGSTWYEGAISERIRNVRIETASGYARVNEITQAFQDVNGNLVARGGMLTDVNGTISGFINHNDGLEPQFDILASKFRVGRWVNGEFIPHLYLTSNQMILEDSWVLAETIQTGTGAISHVGGKPVFNNQARVAIGDNFGLQSVIVASSANVGMAELRSNGYHTFVRGSSSPAITIKSSNATHSGGTAIKSEATTGIADFADGVAQFTAKHPFLTPLNLGVEPTGKLVAETNIYKHSDVNNALSFGELSTIPRSRMAVGSHAQRTKLCSEKDETVAGLSLTEESALRSTNALSYINGLGEGLMWVCSESGDISKGQWLCSSSTKGHAMLQTDETTGDYEKYFTDYTVAKSREDVVWDNEPSNTKLIAVYYKGG
ncbi:phage tail protein [Colwellia sp. 6_MG-2023]|uniref:phage tail protein n=1 Tax=Colwellia sp. 6_MG-2023 TaxID=3062676 RepID=UPI0026E14A3A|nr:phage tail protein [Colwellia sp. 6_MG-2023]MDO6488225.1 phage tail protein [Colwellia sp. 6_MG-2023]